MTVYCDSPVVVETEYREFLNESPAELIIYSVAKAEGVDPLDLRPLFDVIDPETINSIFDRPERPRINEVALHFHFENSFVFVHSDGTIKICDATQTVDPFEVFEAREAEPNI